MNFDAVLGAFGDFEAVPVEALEAALADWDFCAPRFLAMLHGYVHGQDESERTERALYGIVHLLAEKAEAAAFPDLCLLGESRDKLGSVYGPDGAVYSFGRVLVSTFDGDPAPLERLVESPVAEDSTRCDALLVLAYLACEGRIAEAPLYRFLSQLAGRLPDRESELWYGYARAVAALGFAGLSTPVDLAYRSGFILEPEFTAGDFWRELRAARSAGRDVSGADWSSLQPIGSAVEQLQMLADINLHPSDGPDDSIGYAVQEPIRNPLRAVGRNDPCPCGSGNKYKKCCLQTGVA